MKHLSATGRLVCLAVLLSPLVPNQVGLAAEAIPAPPQITAGLTTNGQPRLTFPYPGAQSYSVFGAADPAGPYVTPVPGALIGPTFTVTNPGPAGYYRVSATPMNSNSLFAATVLNRLTYGPTPGDIERIASIGPEQFIEEQLAAEAIMEDLDTAPPIINAPPASPPPTNWIRVSANGIASNTNFFLYLSTAGRVYIDDVRLVLGNTPDAGPNLLVNGDFEDPVITNGWKVASIYSASVVTNSPTPDGLAASGNNCLLLIGSGLGTGDGASLQQPYALTNPANTRYTLSFSYLPVRNVGSNVLTVRLSGTTTIANIPLPSSGPVPPAPPPPVSPLYSKFTNGAAPINVASTPGVVNTLNDLRAYHILRAVQSRRQLYEILVQFFENHFTTEYAKTADWFDNNFANAVTNGTVRDNLAIDLEWREHHKFRQALLNPDCTFHDLLLISIESPAMIVYLDTVLSTRTAANENYARELLELHTFGADNGYVQQDIVELAKIWTGWRVAKKDPSVAGDPHARPVANITNDFGTWVLNFATNSHNYASAKRLFTNVVIDPRFGTQFGGGQPYAFTVATNAYPGTNGMREGYLVTEHLANLPFTAEFLSVKLCRTFVHENFEFGVYDYTAPVLSPEAQLVKDCMTAWNTPAGDGRKGNIRSVLRSIFGSALFRGHAASQQKIKTPLEFAVSAIRALRVQDTDTNNYVSATSETDGYALSFQSSSQPYSPLHRMGGMNLFSKAEPDGYSEFGRIWLSTANLSERWRFIQHLLEPSSSTLKASDSNYGASGRRNTSDPVRLIQLKLPSTSWNDPGAIVDYFLGLIYPGVGPANLGLDREAAVHFLNTADNGAPSPFAIASHDGRVRGMVALLMCFPRFQEQ